MIAARQIFLGRGAGGGGYQVEYVDFGGYYFETDFKPNNNTSFEAEFAYVSNSWGRGQVCFGARDDWQKKAFMYPLNRPVDTSVWLQWGNQVKNVPFGQVLTFQKYKIAINSSHSFLWQNTVRWTPTSATWQCSYPFGVGETLSGGNPIDTGSFSEMRFYQCKVWDDGVLRLDLVPWVEGEYVGVRDVISGKNLEFKLASNQDYSRYIVAGSQV